MSDAAKGFVLLLCGLIFVVALMLGVNSVDRSTINDIARANGLTVVDVDQPFLRTGPFYVRGKNQRIYQVTFKDEKGETRRAWVRTPGLAHFFGYDIEWEK